MKILVLGAGVIGVTTAYALGRQGHEVIVIDKESEEASGASHANAGQLSYSYVDPFPNPGIVKKLPGYMLGRDNGIKINQSLSPHYYSWGMQFLRNCTVGRARKNMNTMLEFAQHSKAAMQRLTAEIPGDLTANNSGSKLILAKTNEDLEKFENAAVQKRCSGFDVETLNREQCIQKEPALKDWRGTFCGGLYAGQEQTIDPLILCRTLRKISEKRFSVEYKFEHSIQSLTVKGNKISGVVTDKGSFDCDKVVMCLGVGTNKVLKTIGKSCNIYPMRGYSLTLPLGVQTPKASVTDPLSKIVFANFGDRVRIAGFLDANLPEDQIQSRGEALLKTARELLPEAADYDANNHLWAGYRPMTPSGVPIVKPSSVDGLYYNMGHGSLGLTLAAGSAEKIAKLVWQSMQRSSTIKVEEKHVLVS